MYFARQLAARYDEIQAAEAELLIVGPGERTDAQRYARLIGARSPVLADPTMAAYDAFLLDKVFMSLIQESAAFVIDKAGIVRFAYVTANPMKWISGDTLSRTLTALTTPAGSAAPLGGLRR